MRAWEFISESVTMSTQFKQWFGSSVVVDSSGKPLVVYHGTLNDIEDGVFRDRTHGPVKLFFFTSDRRTAGVYARSFSRSYSAGSNIVPVYLSLQNPKVLDFSNRDDDRDIRGEAYLAADEGHDGLIVYNAFDGRQSSATQYVVFSPNQIKSATGNNGQFDLTNPDITKEDLEEAEWDPSGWGGTPYGTDIDYFGIRVQMRPSTFLKLAAPLSRSQMNPAVKKHMVGGGKIAYPMLEVNIPAGWEDGDLHDYATVANHEGRNRVTNWIEMHGDEPIQVNIIGRGGMRRRHFTPEIIERLSQGMHGQSGRMFVRGPLFDVNTVLEENLNEIKYSNSISDSSNIVNALTPDNSSKIGVVDHHTVYRLTATDCYVYYLYDDSKGIPLAYIITEKDKEGDYYPFRQAEKLVDTPGVAMALLQFLRHRGMKLVVRSDEPMTLKGITWLTKMIEKPRGLNIHDGSGKPVNLQALWDEWYKAHEDYGNKGVVSIFIESSSKPIESKSDYCFEDQTNYRGLLKNPLRYIGDVELH